MWAGGDEPPPRRPGFGCLAAAIITSIGLVVLAILVLRLLGTALSGVTIR
jgi:hypothetical protein